LPSMGILRWGRSPSLSLLSQTSSSPLYSGYYSQDSMLQATFGFVNSAYNYWLPVVGCQVQKLSRFTLDLALMILHVSPPGPQANVGIQQNCLQSDEQ
jgi:hypothetical protein